MTTIQAATPSGYTQTSYDSTTRILVIQVDGCAKETLIEVPVGVAQGTAAWNALLIAEIQRVQDNMDPSSPTYDPSLVGGG